MDEITTIPHFYGLISRKPDQETENLKHYSAQLYTYLFLPVGVISNLISITIFLRSTFRNTAMGLYLATISIQSEILLITLWLTLYTPFKFDFKYFAWCDFGVFIPIIMFQSTSFLVAAVSLDRYSMVKHPNKFLFIKKLKFQLLLVIVVLAFSILCNISYISFENKLFLFSKCEGTGLDYKLAVGFIIKDIFIDYLIPILIMSITTAIIVRDVFRLKRKLNKNKKLS
jgi:hypothetical protein